jgi:serine/threonine protein kinase
MRRSPTATTRLYTPTHEVGTPPPEALALRQDAPVVPGYEIIDRIGGGGMGSVWRAIQVSLGRQVAIKVIDRRLVSDPRLVERFLREARLQASIDHPHVVPVHDAGMLDDNLAFIVMRYLPGGDVASVVKRHGPLQVEELVRIATGAAAGIEALASVGITHRDIKPENLLLEEDGSVRIGDFGLAWSAHDLGHLTTPGQILGTPAYVSPEQASAKPIDVRTDLYGLGAALFMAATGRPPYTGETAFLVVSNMLTEPVPDPRVFNPQLPGWLARVITTCLNKDPDLRYQRPGSLIEAITRRQSSRGRLPVTPTLPQVSPWLWTAVFLLGLLRRRWSRVPATIETAPQPAPATKRTTRRVIKPPAKASSTAIRAQAHTTAFQTGALFDLIRQDAPPLGAWEIVERDRRSVHPPRPPRATHSPWCVSLAA